MRIFFQFCIAAMVVLLCSMPPVAYAGRAMPSVDDQIERLSQDVALTEDQKVAVRPIVEEHNEKLRPLLESMRNADGKRARLAAYREVREEQPRYRDALAGVLTPEQMEKYDQIREERKDAFRKAMKERRDKS